MRTAISAMSRRLALMVLRLRRRLASVRLDAVDVRAAVGLALIGTGIGLVDVATALIVIGAVVLGFAVYGSLMGKE